MNLQKLLKLEGAKRAQVIHTKQDQLIIQTLYIKT
jgi:hypothetical protein